MTPRPRVLRRLLQPDPDRRRVLRLPGADHHGAVRDHGLRGRPRRPDGLLGRRDDARRSISRRASGSSRPSCRGRPSAAGDVELTDDNGILAGRFAPTVRKPVGELPSGALVLGLADAVVLNDPITGQGSNNAAKCADVLPREHPSSTATARSTAQWMQQTFDRYWDYAQYVTHVDQRAARAAAAARAQAARCAGNDHRRSPRASSTASTIRATSSTGSRTRSRPDRYIDTCDRRA